MELDDAKEKVRKLMAMATDGRGNEFEAEAALRQAEKLMRKHGIDAAELQDRTGQKPVYKWATTAAPVGGKGKPINSAPAWIGWIMVGIGKLTDTKVGYMHAHPYGLCAEFKGDAVDVEFAIYLFKHMRDDCRRQALAFDCDGDRSERESFRKAYSLRVMNRMKALAKERDDALRAHATSIGTALVVVQNKIALRDAEFGMQKYGRSRSVRMRADGAAAGRAAGDRVGFGRPVGQSHQQRLA